MEKAVNLIMSGWSSQIRWVCLTFRAAWQVKRQHPGAQKFGACSTVHGALQGLQTIDLPLGLAVAPTLCQRVCDGVDISPHRSGEALHCVNSRLLRVIEPDAEFLECLCFEESAGIAWRADAWS
jgi:hypothetical protein